MLDKLQSPDYGLFSERIGGINENHKKKLKKIECSLVILTLFLQIVLCILTHSLSGNLTQ